MNPIDDLVLAIALVKADLETEFFRRGTAVGLDIRQGLGAVDVRLAFPEQVEVWAVQDEDEAAHVGSLCWRNGAEAGSAGSNARRAFIALAGILPNCR